MSKSNDYENDLQLLIYNNTSIANIGDATGLVGSTGEGNLFVGLHTADPLDTGNQSTNEATYTSYARVSVARNTGGWTVTANNASNAAIVTFPTASGGTETITHFSIGYESAGSTKMIGSGTVTPNLAVSVGITPEFAIGDIDHDED